MKLSEQGVIPEEALLAYINNELTAEEKQELEKLLKDDPFAQEALEGLQQSNKTNVSAVVVNINKRVRERVGMKEARMIKLHWSNYAWAAVVFGILIGVGFLMVNYMGNQDSAIAMNKEADKSVNLLEKKAEEQNAAPVVINTITDSLTVSEPVTEKSNSQESPAADLQQTTTKIGADRNDDADGKNAKTIVPAKQQTVTATGGAGAPPQAIQADDKATMNGSKVAGNTNAGAAQKGKADNNAYRNANGDAERLDTKPAAKEEVTKKNVEQRREAEAPATETIVRGSIVEKVPANKVTVITMDDAMKSFNGGDYKASSEQFSQILSQQPNNVDALYFGGISDYINGNTKKSEKNFDKLLKEGAKYSEGSKWYKANILLKKGKKDEAKKLLDELANSGGSYKERAVKKKAEMEF